MGESGARFQIVMEEPLGGVAKIPGVEDDNHFDEAIEKVAGGRKVDKLLTAQVNARNRILYAHDSGVPASQVTAEAIDRRERTAHLCILLAVAVLQIERPQSFAMQCLRGFLKIIGRQQLPVYT